MTAVRDNDGVPLIYFKGDLALTFMGASALYLAASATAANSGVPAKMTRRGSLMAHHHSPSRWALSSLVLMRPRLSIDRYSTNTLPRR